MDVGEVASDKKEEDITHFDPFRARTTPCNKCFCKVCCYHCQLCFLQKALGVHYHVYRQRRPRRGLLEKVPSNSQAALGRDIALFLMSSRETISGPTTSNGQTEKEEKSQT
ncbi:tat protein [Simian immunodeficiency virus]|uniref:Protein Tat n=1 Tax=Simian immunodeficiency virus TaxID=11723 RepID=Q7ZB15_SIV|nr:tat protein [Simian immunodeficiency virus]